MTDTVSAIAGRLNPEAKGKGKQKKSPWGPKKSSDVTTLTSKRARDAALVSGKREGRRVDQRTMSETSKDKGAKTKEGTGEKMRAGQGGQMGGEKSGNGGTKRKLSSADNGSAKRRLIVANGNANLEIDVVGELITGSSGDSKNKNSAEGRPS